MTLLLLMNSRKNYDLYITWHKLFWLIDFLGLLDYKYGSFTLSCMQLASKIDMH